MDKVITLGNNKNPPEVNLEVSQNLYDCVRTDEFEVDVFNSILMTLIVYADVHKVDFSDGDLPWAESVGSIQ